MRGGRTEGRTIVTVAASLVVLFLGAMLRVHVTEGVFVGYVLAAAWLNVSVLVGTGGNPYRGLMNSADLARVRGLGPDRGGEVAVDRYVRSALRWPAVTMFFVGAGLLMVLFPEWFGFM